MYQILHETIKIFSVSDYKLLEVSKEAEGSKLKLTLQTKYYQINIDWFQRISLNDRLINRDRKRKISYKM